MKTKFKLTKQTKACLGCPFKRLNTNEKPNPGGSHPYVYLGQTRGPFWLPCHQDKNYEGKGSNTETVGQCRGAAIFRANCGTPYKLPEQLMTLEKDTENVFASEAEFLAHYMNIDLDTAEKFLTKKVLDGLMGYELGKLSETKRYL
jgi:hypothetical protein